MTNLQFGLMGRQFRPSWIGTLATVLCIPLFVHFGQWQYGKAQQKIALQQQYDAYAHTPAVSLPNRIDDPAAWKYKPVKATGEYLTQYQILLDNQLNGEAVGYHVITPLKDSQTGTVVLVDRGWVLAMDNHRDLPKIEAPDGAVDVAGIAWLPASKFFTLGVDESAGNDASNHVANHQLTQPLPAVWQNMDMKAYQKMVPFTVLPIVMRLNADVNGAGGFERQWPAPAERIEMHLSYAYQWYGFAVATLLIYLFVSFKKQQIAT